jgi:hypothetical protein
MVVINAGAHSEHAQVIGHLIWIGWRLYNLISSSLFVEVCNFYIVYSLYFSWPMVLVDAATHYEQDQVIKCVFKLGSVERSIDLYQRGYTSAGDTFNFRHQ